MKLNFLLVYFLIAFTFPTMLKSEDENSLLNESINSEESISKEEDLNKNKIHLVIEGDTLSSIAREYLTNIETLIESNNLSEKNFIYIGQKLIIPANVLMDLNNQEIDPSKFHIVKSGETLTYISLLYEIGIDDLIKMNNIENIDSINIGTKILLDKTLVENESLIIENKTNQNLLNEYGPLKIISSSMELKNNRETLNAINSNGENIIISLNCYKNEIDVRAKGRKWKGWLPAKRDFEKNLLNDFCPKVND